LKPEKCSFVLAAKRGRIEVASFAWNTSRATLNKVWLALVVAALLKCGKEIVVVVASRGCDRVHDAAFNTSLVAVELRRTARYFVGRNGSDGSHADDKGGLDEHTC
jgi:hypothetical protein